MDRCVVVLEVPHRCFVFGRVFQLRHVLMFMQRRRIGSLLPQNVCKCSGETNNREARGRVRVSRRKALGGLFGSDLFSGDLFSGAFSSIYTGVQRSREATPHGASASSHSSPQSKWTNGTSSTLTFTRGLSLCFPVQILQYQIILSVPENVFLPQTDLKCYIPFLHPQFHNLYWVYSI